LLILWLIPYYAVRLDPEPKYLPTIAEVIPKDMNITVHNHQIFSVEDYNKLVTPSDPIIKYTADRIAGLSCEGSRICQAKAIFYFVQKNFQYVSDPLTFEYVKSAQESLASLGGDCDDASVLLANLEEAIGITTRFIFIPGHVYIQIYLPEAARKYKDKDSWVNLDATCSNCGFGEIPYQKSRKTFT
jgi:transglutaminase-like putative cysteine protease